MPAQQFPSCLIAHELELPSQIQSVCGVIFVLDMQFKRELLVLQMLQQGECETLPPVEFIDEKITDIP